MHHDPSADRDSPNAGRFAWACSQRAYRPASHSVRAAAFRLVFIVMLALLPAMTAAQRAPAFQREPGIELVASGIHGAVVAPPSTMLGRGEEVIAADKSRPLGVPTRSATQSAETRPDAPGATSGIVRSATSLTAVIGLILVVAWVVRSLARRQGGLMAAVGPGGRAPSGVVEVLARYPMARNQTLILLKLPRRVIVLSQTRAVRGASSVSALSEIADAEEIAELVRRTRDADNQSLSSKFGAILNGEERGLTKVLGGMVKPALPARHSPSSDTRRPSDGINQRVAVASSGDRVELGALSANKPVPAKRGYAGPSKAAVRAPGTGLDGAELQQRLAALRQLAIERQRRAS